MLHSPIVLVRSGNFGICPIFLESLVVAVSPRVTLANNGNSQLSRATAKLVAVSTPRGRSPPPRPRAPYARAAPSGPLRSCGIDVKFPLLFPHRPSAPLSIIEGRKRERERERERKDGGESCFFCETFVPPLIEWEREREREKERKKEGRSRLPAKTRPLLSRVSCPFTRHATPSIGLFHFHPRPLLGKSRFGMVTGLRLEGVGRNHGTWYVSRWRFNPHYVLA